MEEYCVYRHIFPNGKCYIGITDNPKRRWHGGGGYVNQPKMHNAIKKYGWENVKHVLLHDGLSLHQAQELEKKNIRYYDSIEHGYNLSNGGDAFFAGRHHSNAARKKISEGVKRYTMSDAHKKHISEKKAGVLHHCAKKVYQYTKEGSFVCEWPYMSQASKELYINKSSITACCKGKRQSAGGYTWSYEMR